jgi:hypothetical protein
MAARCPHCRQPTIAWRRKLYAADAFPARCPACGGLSHVGSSYRHMLWLLAPEVAGIALLASWSDSLWYGALGAAVLLAVFAAYHGLAPMVPITAPAVRRARWFYAIGWLVIVGLVAWIALRPPIEGL